MSFGRGRRHIEDFITNLLSKGDGSVFEHVNYGFVITGVSRSLTHELVRHRAGFAYSQRSQRFVDESDSPFVVPPAISEGGAEDADDILKDALEKAAQSYTELVDSLEQSIPAQIEVEGVHQDVFTTPWDRRKAVRQAARAVLPNATETKIFVTANVRAWRHFIEMRGASYADWEIRRLALAVLDILREEAPLLFGDFTIEKLPDGTSTSHPKVLEGLATPGKGLSYRDASILAASGAASSFPGTCRDQPLLIIGRTHDDAGHHSDCRRARSPYSRLRSALGQSWNARRRAVAGA